MTTFSVVSTNISFENTLILSIKFNDESYIGEKFRSSLDFIGKLVQFYFQQVHKQLFVYILALKIPLIKLVMKSFAVCRKSTKTEIFSCVTLV